MVTTSTWPSVFLEITVHPKKFKEENAVLAAMREVIESQGIDPSPLAVVGTIVTGLSAASQRGSAGAADDTVDAVSVGAQLAVLHVACKGVATAVMQRRAEQMIGALAAAVARHADAPCVLKPATACAGQFLRALGGSAASKPASDAQRLYRWLLGLALHSNAKVRSKAQHTVAALVRALPALASPTGKFVAKQIESAGAAAGGVGGGEMQLLFYALNLCAQVLPALAPGPAAAVVGAVCTLPALAQPLLTQVAADALLPALGGSFGGGTSSGAADEGALLDELDDDDEGSLASPSLKPSLPAATAIAAYAAFAAVRADSAAHSKAVVVAATRVCVRAACCALYAASTTQADGPLLERACEQARACVAMLLARMEHEDAAVAKAATEGLCALVRAAAAAPTGAHAGQAASSAAQARVLAVVADALLQALADRHQLVRASVLAACALLLREAPTGEASARAVVHLVRAIAALRGKLAADRDALRLRRLAKQRKRRAERAGAVELAPGAGGAGAAGAEEELEEAEAPTELGHALRALGAAAECLGLRTFLAIVPLAHAESAVRMPALAVPGVTEAPAAASGQDEDTTFLLPLLSSHIRRRAELQLFATHLLPFADGLLDAARRAMGKDGTPSVLSRTCQLLCLQTWALLPPICAAAEDGSLVFASLARRLGETVNNSPELRVPICQALSTLVNANVARTRGAAAFDEQLALPPDSPAGLALAELQARVQGARATLRLIGTFAPKLLPILFNVHAVTASDSRAPLESAISAVASSAEPATLSAFFKSVLAKIVGQSAEADAPIATPSAKRQGELLDLAIALAPHLDLPNSALLWRLVRPQLALASAPTVQKKAYRAALVLLAAHDAFASAHAPDVRDALLEVSAKCAPAARHVRLQALSRCYARVRAGAREGGGAHAEGAGVGDSPALLSELMLATKEPNLKTRAVAYDGLLLLAEEARRRGSLAELLGLVAAGLAGESARMLSASLHCVARLAMAHRRSLPQVLAQGALSSLLVGSPLLLLAHESAEVSRAALVLLRVSAVAAPAPILEEKLPQLQRALCELLDGPGGSVHLHAVRVLLERLGKRVGFDAVCAHAPAAHAALFAHVRRQTEKSDRKREARKDGRRANAQVAAEHGEPLAAGEADDDEADDTAALLSGGYADADVAAAAEEEALLNALGLDRRALAAVAAEREGAARPGARRAGADRDGGDAGEIDDLLRKPVRGARGLPAPARGARARAQSGGLGVTGAAPRKRSREDEDDEDDERADGEDAVAMGSDGILRVGQAALKQREAEAQAEAQQMEVDGGGAADRGGARAGRAGVGAPKGKGRGEESGKPGKPNKRSRTQLAEESDPLGMDSAPELTASQLHGTEHLTGLGSKQQQPRPNSQARGGKTKPSSFGEYLGDDFKPKKAGAFGDVRRPDGQQPYAYMPLNPRLLSKRHKHQAAETMDKFVRHGKRLGTKGRRQGASK